MAVNLPATNNFAYDLNGNLLTNGNVKVLDTGIDVDPNTEKPESST